MDLGNIFLQILRKSCTEALFRTSWITLPRKRGVGGTPSRVLKISAEPVVPPVLPGAAFHVGEERRAHFPDQRLRRVYQRQTFFYVFVTEAVSEKNKTSVSLTTLWVKDDHNKSNRTEPDEKKKKKTRFTRS